MFLFSVQAIERTGFAVLVPNKEGTHSKVNASEKIYICPYGYSLSCTQTGEAFYLCQKNFLLAFI